MQFNLTMPSDCLSYIRLFSNRFNNFFNTEKHSLSFTEIKLSLSPITLKGLDNNLSKSHATTFRQLIKHVNIVTIQEKRIANAR